MVDEPDKPEVKEEKPDEEIDEEALEGVKGGTSRPGIGGLSRKIAPTEKKVPFGGFNNDSVKE